MKVDNKGVIAWFVHNPVAANLLVVFILVTGFLCMRSMERELLPFVESKFIFVSAAYPTASPKEVEEGITLKIEDAIKNIGEIKKVESYSVIGSALVRMELENSADTDAVLNEIKTVVDAITTFPKEVEKIHIRKTKPFELALQTQLYGDIEENQAKKFAEDIRRELLAETIVKRVDILGTRKYEIGIEIDEEQLQKYKLTLRQVANKIRLESVNLPSGGVKTANGNILVRVEGQAYRQQDFENIILLTSETGAVVRLRDIATVQDGYIEQNAKGYFDGKYSVGITVSAVGDQDLVEVAEAAKKYFDKKKQELPPGVYLTSWLDTTYYLQSRLDTMSTNLMFGALLVFLVLIFFMDIKVAFWVMAGLPVGFAGAFILMAFGFENISLNMVSMFGFIMVVGILVDDGIVVAESIDTEIRNNDITQDNVVRATRKVALPVVFGVLTTIFAFLPMLFIEGSKHSYMFAIGFVVCACLFFSLIESICILPSHIQSMNKGFTRFFHIRWQDRLQKTMNTRLQRWVQKRYIPAVTWSIENRYITVAFFVGLLIITMAAVSVGIVKYELFPAEPNDFITASFSMSQGVSEDDAIKAQEKIEKALYDVESDYQKEFATETRLVEHLFRYGSGVGSGSLLLELTKAEEREINSFDVVDRWRKKVGHIEGAVVLDFSGSKVAGSRDLSFMLVGNNKPEMEKAATTLLEELRAIPGMSNISSTMEKKRQEYVIDLKPKAQAFNLTLGDIALQVREAFYGAEAQRIQRDGEEITVLVRYPKNRRSSLVDLEEMHIRLPDGRFMRLKELAEIKIVFAESNIVHINGEHAVFVTAKIDRNVANPGEISSRIINKFIPGLLKQHAGVHYKRDGISLEEKDAEKDIKRYFMIALMGIFVLLAIPLKSYFQPVLIMSVIPFGVVGAVWGHWLLDFPVSIMSLFGLVALSGVVVNDSLIMVDFVNRAVSEGAQDVKTAAINSGGLRFRAIMLTTVTTFVGVFPIILETSVQAVNMIPMAISLGAGILFATFITLFLIPCLYVILEDIKGKAGRNSVS